MIASLLDRDMLDSFLTQNTVVKSVFGRCISRINSISSESYRRGTSNVKSTRESGGAQTPEHDIVHAVVLGESAMCEQNM